MNDVAVAVKVFSRADKLGQLLDSVAQSPISSVYVADDGEPTEEKDRLYEQSYPFDLTVLDLEYDAGLGYGRNRIVEASDEEFLLVVDSDHEIPTNVSILRDQLEARPAVGGVSGLLYEHKSIQGVCHDLYENGDVLVRDVREDKSVDFVGGPLVEFDFLPNVALFRRACLEEQAWDPEYVIGKEHIDFYVAHKRRTDWSFCVSPTVLFPHHPGGDESYTVNRQNMKKLTHSKSYFLEKWGYRQTVLGQTDWVDGTSPRLSAQNVLTDAVKTLLLSLPPAVQTRIMDLRDRYRRRKRLPPL